MTTPTFRPVKTRRPLPVRGLAALLLVVLCILVPATDSRAAEDPRKDAVASWTFGPTGASASENALETVGDVEFLELSAAEKASALARGGTGWFARLAGGHLNGGTHLNITGAACTVYLRVREPGGAWEGGLFSKRGSHEIVNFNLFAANGRIGGEFHGESAALGSVAFPSEGAVGNGWHDLVLRYDGQTIDIFCDGAPMAAVAWTGGSLTQNDEPLLIGAESVNGSPVRPFRGDVEKAALWSRALTDEEIAAISPSR
jgi:hypothetical protein